MLKVLRQHCQDSGNAFGFYNVEFSDGSHVNYRPSISSPMATSLAARSTCAGLHRLLLPFVFEVAVAGDMIIFNAQGRDTADEPLAIIFAHSSSSLIFPQRPHRNPVFCSSPYRLAELLGIGIEKCRAEFFEMPPLESKATRNNRSITGRSWRKSRRWRSAGWGRWRTAQNSNMLDFCGTRAASSAFGRPLIANYSWSVTRNRRL